MMREDGNLRLVSVFLAGGVGRRFGGNKLLADAGGAPVLARLFERVLPVLRRRSQRVFLIAHDPACAVLGEERGLSVITGTFPQRATRCALPYRQQAMRTGSCFCSPTRCSFPVRALRR